MTCNKFCEFGALNPRQELCCNAEQAANGRCSAPREVVTRRIYCNEIGCVDGLTMNCPIGERPGGETCQMICPAGSYLDPTGACVLDDDPPPPVSSFGCQNCNPQYTPEGCSTNPADPNYTVDCQVSYDCSGHPTGPAPVCNTTTQWCNPDNLCTGGANSVGIGSTTRRLSPPSQKAKHPKVCIISYHLKKIVRCSPRQEVV